MTNPNSFIQSGLFRNHCMFRDTRVRKPGESRSCSVSRPIQRPTVYTSASTTSVSNSKCTPASCSMSTGCGPAGESEVGDVSQRRNPDRRPRNPGVGVSSSLPVRSMYIRGAPVGWPRPAGASARFPPAVAGCWEAETSPPPTAASSRRFWLARWSLVVIARSRRSCSLRRVADGAERTPGEGSRRSDGTPAPLETGCRGPMAAPGEAVAAGVAGCRIRPVWIPNNSEGLGIRRGVTPP